MKSFLTRQVPLAWLLAILVAAPAAGIVFKLLVLDAPPAGLVITDAEDYPTPRGGILTTPTKQADDRTSPVTQIERAATTAAPTTTQERAAQGPPGVKGPGAGSPSSTPVPEQLASPTPALLVVYVSGAVQKPGVYSLSQDGRVADAIRLAGGLTNEAEQNAINLAAHVEDEEHIVVPKKGETPLPTVQSTTRAKVTATPALARGPAAAVTTSKAVPSVTPQSTLPPHEVRKININTASTEELTTLPGIGPALAAKIIAYREQHGQFTATEDLMQVSGIKEGIYSKVRDMITVAP